MAASTPVECLDWEVVGNLVVHLKGAALVSALIALKADLNPNFGGNTMAVLLEASDRKPVLTVHAVGMAAWMCLIDVLQELRLKDRLENENDPVGGFDAIFSCRSRSCLGHGQRIPIFSVLRGQHLLPH